jgi:hypothetical protein
VQSYDHYRDGLEDRISKLERDMWHGNGKSGVTTRLEKLEDNVQRLFNYNEKRDARNDKKFNIILTGIVSLLVAVVVDFLFRK